MTVSDVRSRQTSEAPAPVVRADEDALRANVYALLGNLLAAPPDRTLLDTLAGIAPDPGDGTRLASSWRMLGDAAARADLPALHDEYQALFIGLGRGEVVPYGSWYLTGFLMEEPLARLRGDLLALGIERQPGVSEPEDHAAALCDAMAMLIAGEPPASIPQQQQFFARHIEPWIGRFFRDVQQADSARFYRAVAHLGEHFMNVETKAFGVATPAAGCPASETTT